MFKSEIPGCDDVSMMLFSLVRASQEIHLEDYKGMGMTST